MKIAAITLAAGLLAGACSGGGEPEPTQTATQPPLPSATPPAATPTMPPPLESTSGIDITDWQQYESPLGVTISYPRGWTLSTFEEDGELRPQGAYDAVLSNGVRDPTGEAGGTPGVSLTTLRRYPAAFDPQHFLGICLVPESDPYSGGQDFSHVVAVDGRRAVFCEGHNLTPARLENYGFTLYIEMPDGQVVEVSAGGYGAIGDDMAIARAITESVTLTPIDTSGWPTFSSPLGFDIKYPPDWTVVESDLSTFPGERVRICNELTYAQYLERVGSLGLGYAPVAGEAWFDILPDPFGSFDVDGLISGCGIRQTSQASETTVAGHRAVRCVQTGPSFDPDLVAEWNILWIEQPVGRVIHVGYTVHGGDQDILALVNAAFATITFHE